MRRLQQPGRHVGITLSVEQKAWAEEHLAAEGCKTVARFACRTTAIPMAASTGLSPSR